ncbi:hypothetical protein LCGC14_0710530 [marine sediment metagenome]|uniref:Uncharacterized protein n=1 Tax=marine sediment metagenome TaxID=412755 RepID=A0A0F9QJP1_9ZZZZ
MFHIGGKGLFVLPHHIPAGISYLVHHTYLGLGIREHVPDGIGKAVQVIGGRDQDVLGAAGLDIGEHGHPESGGFILAEPQAQYLLLSVPAKPYGYIDRFVDDLGALADLEHDTVHPYDHVDRFQRTVLPCGYVARYLFGDSGNGGRRYIKIVDLPYLFLDIAVAHALGRERYDHVLDAVDHVAPFGDYHQAEGRVPVPWHGDLGLPERGPYLLFGVAVARIARLGPLLLPIVKVTVQFPF